MIHLAIDEMQNAESRMQNVAGEDVSWLQPHSALCTLHSAFREGQMQRDEVEERLKQTHLQAGNE